MGIAEGTVGASVIIGATAGIANAVGQGLMIGLNVQKQFSMSSVLMSAVTAGVGSYVLPEGLSTPQSLGHLADQVLRVGTIAVSNQLSQMAAGYQNYFDARSLVSAITVTLAGLGVDSGMVSSFGESLGTTISQNILHGIADTGINSLIYHQQLSVMQMAAQALGTNLAAAVSRPIIDNLKSMLGVEHSIGYQSAQQAGRGQVEHRGFGGVNATVRSFDVTQYSPGRINATTRVVNQTQTQRSLAPMVMDEFDLSIAIDGSDQSVVRRFESEGARQGSLARSRAGFFNNPNFIKQRGVYGESLYDKQSGLTYVPDSQGGYRTLSSGAIESVHFEEWILPLPKVGAVRGLLGIGGNSSVSRLGFWSEDSASSTLRQTVLTNIAESRAARNASNIPVFFAKESQFMSGYNLDTWEMITLEKGTVVLGGLPGRSEFYTTMEDVILSRGKKDTLYKSLQVRSNPERGGYRSNIGEYIVTQKTRIPSSIVENNPDLGFGGARQFFISDFEKLNLQNEVELGAFYENRLPTYRPGY